MRGHDHQQSDMFSYLSPAQRVRKDYPLRAIRPIADQALNNMSERFDAMYAKTGRPSIPPEKWWIFTGRRDPTIHTSPPTDPDALLARKGNGKEAKLSYNGNLLLELNRDDIQQRKALRFQEQLRAFRKGIEKGRGG